MAYEEGDIKTFNPQKEISKEIILDILIRHRDAFKQARTGELVGTPMEELADSRRKINQVRALNLIISAQREMVTISRPMIVFRSTKQWEKKFKEEEDQEKNPFKDYDCDYKTILNWLKFLRFCEQEILIAERTPAIEDDFLVEKDLNGQKTSELTENFFGMLEDLEESYEQINLLMLTNKIISAGIEDDEELTYKQKEEEMVRRVEEA